MGYRLANDSEIGPGYRNAWDKITKENDWTMKNTQAVEWLVSERWPKLKERAENEKDVEKLIAILEEIDDVLFSVEMRVAAESGRARSRDGTDSRSVRRESGATRSDDSEIGSP
jgi:hypothetical protein